MTALPAAADFTGSSVTEADFKTAMTNIRAYLAGLHGADGTVATALSTVGSLLTSYVAKSANYGVLAADRGKLINCTASGITITTPAAATVGAGYAFGIRNSSAGNVTLDGNAAETVDGVATVAIGAGESALIVSTGTAWLTVGRTAGIADGSITTAKLATAVGFSVYNYNIAQSCTTTYTDYISQSITLDTTDAIIALATVNYEITTPGSAGNNPIGLRLVVDGVARATNTHAIAWQAAHDTPATLTVVARVTGLSSGSRTAAAQVYAGSGVPASAMAGSLLIIKEPT